MQTKLDSMEKGSSSVVECSGNHVCSRNKKGNYSITQTILLLLHAFYILEIFF